MQEQAVLADGRERAAKIRERDESKNGVGLVIIKEAETKRKGRRVCILIVVTRWIGEGFGGEDFPVVLNNSHPYGSPKRRVTATK